MTGTNEFLTFGIGTGANVLDQADYDGLPARNAGFSSGIAKSIELNKVWRQASVIASMIGQFVADHSGGDALDDGDVATLLGLFEAALSAAVGGVSGFAPIANSVHVGTDTGTVDAMVATFTPTVTSLTDGLFFEITPAATNTGATTLNANGLGVVSVVRITGATLSAGDIQARGKTLLAYDSTLSKFVLLTPHLASMANYVLRAGDTMLGALTLAGAPINDLHAATKKYVDDLGGTLASYLLKSGGTMTGALTLYGAPTASLHAATKAYVDALVSSLTAGRLVSTRVVTSSQTWTRPAGVGRVLVFATGGGGAGGYDGSSGSSAWAGGGGAGSTSISIIDVSSVSTVSCVIGAGGTGRTGYVGSNGGTTSFGTYAVAGGGQGGGIAASGYRYGGLGGTATTGDMRIGGGGGGGGSTFAGEGGASFWGGGGPANSSFVGISPDAKAYGAGGAAGGALTAANGSGGNGVIFMLEFA